ncbi:MAG: sugar transferase [Taibaiella sp.]|nr:sugar transferase [Taibaiella sp.]
MLRAITYKDTELKAPLIREEKPPALLYYDDTINEYSLKRGFDIVVAAFGIATVLLWIYPVVWLLIKLSSPGKGLFVQKRTGYKGKTFNCYKFRTMVLNRDADICQAQEEDLRVTTIGKWMRRTHIDELPQLINVLVGDMSIVGPRPHMLLHDSAFGATVPTYRQRSLLRPGITGLAQVMGYHGYIKDYKCIAMRTRLDLFYLKKNSLLLDVRIMLRTITTFLKLR